MKNVHELFKLLTETLGLAVRKNSVGARYNRDKSRWEVSALINRNPGWVDAVLGTFDTAAEAVELKRLLNA